MVSVRTCTPPHTCTNAHTRGEGTDLVEIVMASLSASRAGITPSPLPSNHGLATRVRGVRRVVFRRLPLLKHLVGVERYVAVGTCVNQRRRA